MEILTKEIKIRKVEEISHDNELYKRIEYVDNSFVWEPISFNGEDPKNFNHLEKEYQTLIQNIRQIEMCSCGQHPEKFCLEHCAN